MKKMCSSTRYLQFMAGFTATLSYLSCGAFLGWTSPVLPRLQAENSHLPLTGDEASWVLSALTMLVPVAALLMPFAADMLGRKVVLAASALPAIASWMMVLYADSAALLVASRMVAGLSLGITLCVGPMYLGEIAEDSVRGALGTLFQLMISSGMLFEYVLGPRLPYASLAVASVCFPAVFFATFVWMPESPYFLLMRGRDKQAETALRRLRPTEDVSQELEVIRRAVDEQKGTGVLAAARSLLTHRGSRRALVVCVGLMLLQQATGITTLLGYMTQVFLRSGPGSLLGADDSSIVVGCVQVVVSVATSGLVDRAGRRPLLLLSAVGCALTHAVLGTYFCLKDIAHVDVSSVQWLPLTAFIIFLVVFTLGLGPVPWAVVGEVFPSNVKALASALVTVALSVSGAIIAKMFQVVSDSAGDHVMFYVFSACSLAGTVFIYLCVPETKGLSLLEISKMFHGDHQPDAEKEKCPQEHVPGDAAVPSIFLVQGEP